MGWERGYYIRVRRAGRKLVRDYYGRGPIADLIAEWDAAERLGRQVAAAASRARRAGLDALEAAVAAEDRVLERAVRAALAAAGFHQHHRGEWRRRRGRKA